MEIAQRIALCIAAFLFFGSATIGFKWVTSPYLWGYLAAGFGFVSLSFLVKTFS
jgi:hypothetical protein